MMTSKEIAEMIQRAKEAEALFDDLRDDERPVYSTLQKVGSALDELIQFAERPVYETVKIDGIANGWYWVVSPEGFKSIESVYMHEEYENDRNGYYRIKSYYYNDSVRTLISYGYSFYKIPPLEVPE